MSHHFSTVTDKLFTAVNLQTLHVTVMIFLKASMESAKLTRFLQLHTFIIFNENDGTENPVALKANYKSPCPNVTPWRCIGGVKAKFQSFYAWALVGGVWPCR